MKRWILFSVLGTFFHLAVSAALLGGAFLLGMASFTSGSGKESRLCLGLFAAWNSPYEYGWKPMTSLVLPATPPAKEIPKVEDQEGRRVYEDYRKECLRVASMHTAVRNLGYVFSSVIGGCVLGGIYILIRKRNPSPAQSGSRR